MEIMEDSCSAVGSTVYIQQLQRNVGMLNFIKIYTKGLSYVATKAIAWEINTPYNITVLTH